MGQLFLASVYNVEGKKCSVIDADKFHANCYSFSGAVRSIHYYLRQGPFRVMWIGDYIIDRLTEITREEDLLGISTCYNCNDFNTENKDNNYIEKVNFIENNNNLWEKECVWDISKKYFNWNSNLSVKYEGYLINHTKKLAVNLKDYYEKSKSYTKRRETYVVDPVPVLTETGGGIEILLFEGLSAKTTEKLAKTWCGDLLQITDELPENYSIIECCFLEATSRYLYCYFNYGVNEEDFVLDNNGEIFSAVSLNMHGRRSYPCHIKARIEDNHVIFNTFHPDE